MLMLNPAGTVQATENLHPQTKAIYDSVCAPFSLEQVLTREVLPLQPSPDNIDYDTLPFRHLSIRVPEDTLDAFKEFCAEQNLTQKDALRLLLLSQEDLCCQKLTASIQNEFAKKDAIIADLESVIGKKRAQIQRTRERSRVIAATCQQYVREMISHVPAPTYPKLKALSFKTAKRTLDFSSYLYPTTSGYEYFQLEHLVYGRGCASALFALGRNAVGDKIKLRWYDRDSYVGTRFKWSSRAYKGSPWLVGYTVAPDGATDLVVALPLGNAEAVACKEATPHTAPALHPSIDEIISAAEKGAK
ncbi:MAG: hypothetical protein IKL80_02505 [Clostridia bacterium]|nr:hypothetical protein [Clostridia bacterium]